MAVAITIFLSHLNLIVHLYLPALSTKDMTCKFKEHFKILLHRIFLKITSALRIFLFIYFLLSFE